VKVLGFVLVVLGVLTVIYGGFSYNRQRTVFEVGSIKATATEQRNVPLSPIAGGIAIVVGLALLIVPRRQTAQA
jgi:hypothetical protein